MYQVVTVEDEIAVPPTKLGLDIKKSVKESIEENFEGKIDNDIGVVLAVKEIEEIKEGMVLPGDPSVQYPVKFKLLTSSALTSPVNLFKDLISPALTSETI